MTAVIAPSAPDVIVGIGELGTSGDFGSRIITYALGSCLGITAYDPVRRVGAMLHAMLPDSRLDAAKAAAHPCMFVDTGMTALFDACTRLGAHPKRLVLSVAGGAGRAEGEADQFKIGQRNMQTLRKVLWKVGCMIHAHDVGGTRLARTMSLDIATGAVTLRVNGATKTLGGAV
jgi:chemotaxis protein CheD